MPDNQSDRRLDVAQRAPIGWGKLSPPRLVCERVYSEIFSKVMGGLGLKQEALRTLRREGFCSMAKCLTIVNDAGRLEVENELRQQICKAGRRMYRGGFLVACEGNLSVRVDPDRILVTPAGVCKGHLAPQDLLVTDLNGIVEWGTGRPSSEILMHLLFYRLRPEVQAVCHAHPPTATGFAAAGRALDEAVLPEVIVDLGTIPLAPYGTPGTWELCESLESLVAKHDAILLENHGVVTCGQNITTAYHLKSAHSDLSKVPDRPF